MRRPSVIVPTTNAELFNNRLVSQRFILLARSTELRGDKFERRSGAQQTANNRRIRGNVCLPASMERNCHRYRFVSTRQFRNWSPTNCRKLRELLRLLCLNFVLRVFFSLGSFLYRHFYFFRFYR